MGLCMCHVIGWPRCKSLHSLYMNDTIHPARPKALFEALRPLILQTDATIHFAANTIETTGAYSSIVQMKVSGIPPDAASEAKCGFLMGATAFVIVWGV